MAFMNVVCFTLVGLCCVSCAVEEVMKETSRQETHGERNSWETACNSWEDLGCDKGADAPKSSFSFSVSTFDEWLFVKVIGTGEACYSFEHRHRFREFQEFGEYASSEAFAELYGFPECTVGDVGLAFGKIRANVVAAAYENGPECLSRVIASVVEDPLHFFSTGDVSVKTSGESVGEALALCETASSLTEI